ncbi:MAG TPA: hypothetical protein VNY05_36830 [Candidatus Acidoferrales bacterium]|nr:hypothetical protein [Candidatus Acidoferrales bacterium]
MPAGERLMAAAQLDRPELKETAFVPALPTALVESSEDDDIFALIRRQNIVLHHPFDSFQPVIEFLRTAARDPGTLAIKACLYLVGGIPRWWKRCWMLSKRISRSPPWWS